MQVTYQAVLFNVDRPAEPSQAKAMFISKTQYEYMKTGEIKEIQLGENVYQLQGWRAFDITSELFGTRHMLIVDVKKVKC